MAKILDCTIRDGGYINNWDFEINLVKHLYKALSKSGVDYVELGFRSSSQYFDSSTYGPWRFTPEELIDDITTGIVGTPISLMCDYGKIDLEDVPNSSESKVSLYRIAVHKNKVLDAIELANEVARKGYEVAIQLMGIVSYSDDDFDQVLRPLESSDLTYVYFADSYGSLIPSDIERFITLLKQTDKEVGFHSHNNLQLAFANTLSAVHHGVDIVDGTVFGMGRGAGNLPLETLIAYLEKLMPDDKYNVLPILELIDKHFLDLSNKWEWGYNLPYMLSGMYGVHPYFASTLVDTREYRIEDIQTALKIVQDIKPVGFDKNLVDRIVQTGIIGTSPLEIRDVADEQDFVDRDLDYYSEVKYVDRHIGRDFVVLANGPSLVSSKEKIDRFINRYDPIIMGANFIIGLFIPHYHVFSNKKRFIDYIKTVHPDSKLLISSSFSPEFIEKHCDRQYEVMEHDPRLMADFEIRHGIISSNCRTVSILSVAVAIVMGAQRIFLAGLDGYKNVDFLRGRLVHFYSEADETTNYEVLMDKHRWNEKLLKEMNNYLLDRGRTEIVIITPTTHKPFYKSIDGFLLRSPNKV